MEKPDLTANPMKAARWSDPALVAEDLAYFESVGNTCKADLMRGYLEDLEPAEAPKAKKASK